MSEETVDPNSKTSLFKRWVLLAKADVAKWQGSLTSVSNALFVGVAIWTLVGPYFENKGAVQANARVASLEADLTNAVTAKEAAEGLAVQNQKGYEAASADKAQLALDLDACRADPPAKEVEKATKHEASLTPPITKVRVKKTPVVKPVDPTLYEQFVAWLETQNVGAPQ